MKPILGLMVLLLQLDEAEELGLISFILLEKSSDVSSKTDSAIRAWAVMPAFRLMVGLRSCTPAQCCGACFRR